MSNYCDLHCKTCDVGAGFYVNHGEEQLARLIPSLVAIAAFTSVVGRSAFEIKVSELYSDTGGGDIVGFAIAHSAHDVGVRSEYGYYHDQCSDYVSCPTCGDRKCCTLPLQHAGDHARDWSKR